MKPVVLKAFCRLFLWAMFPLIAEPTDNTVITNNIVIFESDTLFSYTFKSMLRMRQMIIEIFKVSDVYHA